LRVNDVTARIPSESANSKSNGQNAESPKESLPTERQSDALKSLFLRDRRRAKCLEGLYRKEKCRTAERIMSFQDGLKTIVVATDLEGQAEAALEYSRKLAVAYHARIVLAHGLDPMEYAAVDAVPDRVLKGLTEEARKVLDRLAAELIREGIHSHSEVRQGSVAEMLVDVARQYKAGLIVISTKGLQGAGSVVVGAIAERLVRLAPCPVLAVAADWNAGPNRPTPGGPVLLAMERNDAAQAAATAAASLAETFERPLIVLHVRTAAEKAAGLNPCTVIEEQGIRFEGTMQVRSLVKDGDPADAVAKMIAEHHPSILVAGVKRTSGTPGPHGTAFALLSASRVPVLCVPPEVVGAGMEREMALPLTAV
jgi:nucleotide-binding universal stress UspA family protein